MGSYKKYRDEKLNTDPELKAEYDALQPEYDIIQAMIDARKQKNMTQKDLSEITGITQADISRIENGTRNPSLEDAAVSSFTDSLTDISGKKLPAVNLAKD